MKQQIRLISLILFLMSSTTVRANKELISLFLPRHPVIVEAGAHIGGDTQEMVALWPDCTIHAFEPAPEIFKKLTYNTSHLPNVHRYPLALSDKKEKALFYLSSGTSDGSSSLLEPKEHLNIHQTVYFRDVAEVDTITLDEWAAINNVDHIDFMWLDMQGHEYTMLKASPKMLSTVQVLYLEISYEELYIGTALFPEVRVWLESQGFKYITEIEENALFVRNTNPLLQKLGL